MTDGRRMQTAVVSEVWEEFWPFQKSANSSVASEVGQHFWQRGFNIRRRDKLAALDAASSSARARAVTTNATYTVHSSATSSSAFFVSTGTSLPRCVVASSVLRIKSSFSRFRFAGGTASIGRKAPAIRGTA
eukprot:CAMPEP_0184132568 /NCGR_PEP_ID=MMETSP0974-20121125/28688_1 /TAXON_ID=483370 /ORGANISM="non described non described, Strain CCMP2097" /LENGTH=131 /DNA_ID=CAMNT_0026436077 /DNA_START=65 /DNA_END=458 /DNA_ORIENTATION=-